MSKERIDALLYKLKMCESRSRAAAYIYEGRVTVNGVKVQKPGEKFDEATAKIEFKNPEDEYVSRGAYKLLRAFETFGISVNGKLCLDIGASTGGFTHVMLKSGARKVICVDVGTNVLHPKIRTHEKVTWFEQTHILKFNLAMADEKLVDFITCDVSFISVLKFAEKFKEFLRPDGETVILIKPQFEAEVNEVKKGGVVLDREIHKRIILNFIARFTELGFKYCDIINTPKLKDAKNIEYLIFFKKSDKMSLEYLSDTNQKLSETVALKIEKAFLEFNGI